MWMFLYAGAMNLTMYSAEIHFTEVLVIICTRKCVTTAQTGNFSSFMCVRDQRHQVTPFTFASGGSCLRTCCHLLQRKERARMERALLIFSLPESNNRGVSHRIYPYAGSSS